MIHLASRHALPAIYWQREFAEIGGHVRLAEPAIEGGATKSLRPQELSEEQQMNLSPNSLAHLAACADL